MHLKASLYRQFLSGCNANIKSLLPNLFTNSFKSQLTCIFASCQINISSLIPGASILYFLAIVAGLVLLIIPGIIAAIAFGFFQYVVVDKGVGPIESLKQSRTITRGARMKILLFALTSFGVTVLGFLFFIVGLLVAIPVTTLAGAWVYRQLERQTNAQVVSSPVV